MKKTTVNISYDEEKLSTLKLYLERKGIQVEDELTKALDALYAKNVPAGVREFIDLRSGNVDVTAPKLQKPKPERKIKTEATANETH